MKTIIAILMLALTGCTTADLVSIAGDFGEAGKQVGRHMTDRVIVIYDERSAQRAKRREVNNEIVQRFRQQAAVAFAAGDDAKGMTALQSAVEHINRNMPSASDIVKDSKKFRAALKNPSPVDPVR